MNLLQKNKGFASLQVILVIVICLSIIGFLFSEVEYKKEYVKVRTSGLEEQLKAESVYVVFEEILINKLELLYNNPPLSKIFTVDSFNLQQSNIEIQRYALSRLTQYGYQDLRTSIRTSKVLESAGYENIEFNLSTYIYGKPPGTIGFRQVRLDLVDKEMISRNLTDGKDFALKAEIIAKKDGKYYIYRKNYFFNLPYFTEEELLPAREAFINKETNYKFQKNLFPKDNLISSEATYAKG